MPGDVVVYDGLDRRAEKIAREAVTHIADIQQRLVTDIVEIGNTLIRVKDAVGHGRFLPWLKAEFNWTERTAQNYMSVAERFGSNAKCLSHLPLATVYQLAAPTTPDELRNEVIAKLEGGEPVRPSDIADELSEVRRAAKQEREAVRLTILRERRKGKKLPEARAKAEAARERQRARHRAAVAAETERRQRMAEQRAEAADLIVGNLPADTLARVLELLDEPGRELSVSRRELIEAQDRKG